MSARWWILLVVPLMALCAPPSKLELFESIPLETSLGEPGLRSTGQVWLETIDGARESLEICQFYISDGTLEPPGNPAGRESLVPVLKAVERAAGRGVQVRILVDRQFLEKYPRTVEQLGMVPNIRTAVLDLKRLGGGVQHAKYLLADGQTLCLGSANWDWRALSQIHELGIRVEDEFVGAWVRQLFELDWALCDASDRRAAEALVPVYPDPFPVVIDGARVTPVAAPLNLLPTRRLWNGYQLVRLVEEASRSLDLQVMTYAPLSYDHTYWDLLDRALRHAAQRGVAVRLLVSDWSTKEHQRPWLESLDVLPGIEVRVSSLPEHPDGPIPFARVEHCKYLVTDGENAWLGSSNWERDYFHSSRNLGLVIEGGELPARLESVFNRSWQGSWTHGLEESR